MTHSADNDDLRQRVTRLDSEVAAIRTDVAGVMTSVAHLDRSVSAGFEKLDRFISKSNDTKGNTVANVKAVLEILLISSLLVGGAVGGIVYIASNLNAVDVALLRYRVERIYGSFGWDPVVETSPARTTERDLEIRDPREDRTRAR